MLGRRRTAGVGPRQGSRRGGYGGRDEHEKDGECFHGWRATRRENQACAMLVRDEDEVQCKSPVASLYGQPLATGRLNARRWMAGSGDGDLGDLIRTVGSFPHHAYAITPFAV